MTSALPTSQAALLTATKLNKTVHVGDQSLSIIKDVNIHVNAGEFVVIMGKSGSGKSTLLGLLAALDYPDSGDVELAGQTLSRLNEDALAIIRLGIRELDIRIIGQYLRQFIALGRHQFCITCQLNTVINTAPLSQ